MDRDTAKEKGCTCKWWGGGSIVDFDPDCPIRGQHIHRDPRIDRDQLFLQVAHLMRLRSSCLRGKVGSVIVRDRRIISTGYNGSTPGAPHCFEIGCDTDANTHDEGCTRTIHAEANAVIFAARHGISVASSTMYCTHATCKTCAATLANAGITRFVYNKAYRLERLDILTDAGIEVVQLDLVPLPE